MSQDLPGYSFGQYRIVDIVGQGGMATVYKAYQPSVDRFVAIKMLSPDLTQDENFVKRFEIEAKAVASLEHPHILPLFDFGELNGTYYIVMRLIESGTLADLIYREASIPYDQIVKFITDIAAALDYAHSRGVVHRDIKSSNILVDPLKELFLTDFGLAKMMHGPYNPRVTDTGTVVGTAAYMAPERAAGDPIDGRSDIYSLGVVLFELLAGQLPFDGDTPMAVALKHIQDPIPSVREINPSVPPEFEAVVFKGMAKWPDERYQTAKEMAEALQAAWRHTTAEIDAVSLDQTRDDTAANDPTQPLPTQPDTATQPTVVQPAPADAAQELDLKPTRVPWLWIGAVAAIILVAAWLWLRPVKSTVPANSILNSVSISSDILDDLGTLESRHPRTNYSRQPFENGVMLWWDNPTGAEDIIFVIPGGTTNNQGDDWSRYKNTWTSAGDPVFPPDCPEAKDPIGPMMGFGKLWCYNAAVNNALGAPTGEEFAKNDATVELFSNAVVFDVPVDHQIWVLLEDGRWTKNETE
ncbi:MAG: serine/threonine protein kinase [Anaerolineae bacterium]|nr:serine/threonine protein kinase [Anaerolineae bacterium]